MRVPLRVLVRAAVLARAPPHANRNDRIYYLLASRSLCLWPFRFCIPQYFILVSSALVCCCVSPGSFRPLQSFPSVFRLSRGAG